MGGGIFVDERSKREERPTQFTSFTPFQERLQGFACPRKYKADRDRNKANLLESGGALHGIPARS